MANDAFVTQVALEAIAINPSNARASQVVGEAVAIDSASARTSQILAEAVGIDSASARATQVLMEAVSDSIFGLLPEYFTNSESLSAYVISHIKFVNLTDTLPDFADNVTANFGTPIGICPAPLLCVNPGPIEVPNAILPAFPLSGDTIAYNMSIAPVSLVINLVDNDNFAAGLYAFYEKNNSVWYKFKTASSGWSSLEYLDTCGDDVGVSDSRTIFDCAGYPVTAYRDLNGYIGVHYYLDGVGIDKTTPFQGKSPNVIVVDGVAVVMYIPPSYTNFLYFVNSADCYAQQCIYTVNVPNNLMSFTLRQISDFVWTFSFTSELNGVTSVYFAETKGS